MDCDCGKIPYPPFYSIDEFIWTTPFVYGPTLLLTIAIAFAVPRYFHNINKQSTNLSYWTRFIVFVCLIVSITFVFDSIVLVTRAITDEYWTSTVLAYYIAVSWLSWSLYIIAFVHEAQLNQNHWYWMQYLFWLTAVAMETVVGWYWLMGVKEPLPGTVFTIYDHLFLGIFISRYIIVWIIFLLSLIQLCTPRSAVAESSPLLGSTATIHSQQQRQYGSTTITTTTVTITERSPVSGFVGKMGTLLSFIWPHKNLKLKLYVLLCLLFMTVGFAVNLVAPRQIGHIVDDLEKGHFSWLAVVVYIGLKSLQGGSGFLQSIQNWIWSPISQCITQDLSARGFSHLHNLSSSFHNNRKTGDVLRVMNRGTSAVVSLLNQILFQTFPVWINIILVTLFTSYIYAPVFGSIVFTTTMLYMYVTFAVTQWRAKYRKAMVELDNNARTKAVDSLLNLETVKSYNAEGFELSRYKDAIKKYQQADWKNSMSLNILSLAQNTIITGGLLIGSLLLAYRVSQGQLSPGDFVAFNMYMLQLYTPLHWFGTYYRLIQSSFIDMEKMMTLLEEEQTVKEAPYAKDLQVSQGHIVFDNVTFAYDESQPILNGISFSVPKGATVALVGPSGSGKSTILRLLFRFYDIRSGHIYIDGQDIHQVTQASLRKNIGYLPRETAIFNESIYYNIQYGDIHANAHQIKRAAKEAHIHNKIKTFSNGYETKVGERGIRLTSDEKQRVSIARTILKNPPIILLSEATATERRTQQIITDMTKTRTTLIVAQRLSTIVDADLILVMQDGKIVEKGTHQELIEKATLSNEVGVYYEMWRNQLSDDDDSETHSEASPDQSDSDSISTIDDPESPPSQKPQMRPIQQQLHHHHHHDHIHSTRSINTQVIEIEHQHGKQPEMSQRDMETIELDEEEEEQAQASTGSMTIETIEIDSDTEQITSKSKGKRK